MVVRCFLTRQNTGSSSSPFGLDYLQVFLFIASWFFGNRGLLVLCLFGVWMFYLESREFVFVSRWFTF